MKLFRMRRSCRGNTYVAEHLTIKNRPGVRNRLILPADDHYALEAWERMSTGGLSVSIQLSMEQFLPANPWGIARFRDPSLVFRVVSIAAR